MARLISVNVGLPQDIQWNGHTVHTGIWKRPVTGRCAARRLHLDGDGQGDLVGHGGEQRAVLVYQLDSYRYWQQCLKTDAFVHGQFGENFTVDGLSDDTVCIGDRYRIGTALFEVTQPRVTCYRVGIRMNEPRMPAWLTATGRPGFYCRVLQEGDVGAGDEIVKVGEAQIRMTIAEINGLLYSAHHPRDRLAMALRIEALSPGWRQSFDALYRTPAPPGHGNAGLIPAAAAHPVPSGFRPLRIVAVGREADDVISLTLDGVTGPPLPPSRPGQYVVLRMETGADRPPLFRSYSLSGSPSSGTYRISVKLELHGAAGAVIGRLRVGDTLEASLPRGAFTLSDRSRPVVLLSAGIGVTPVLAMLHQLAESRTPRQVLWVYQARDRQHQPFAAEVRALMASLSRGRSFVCYSRPAADDRLTEDFDAAGHLSRAVLETIGIPGDADVYLCGPPRFMADMKSALLSLGIPGDHIQVEVFAGGEAVMPGVLATTPPPAPHPPAHDRGDGVLVSFARSGIAARWDPSAYHNLLELAEACDVPVRWSCRAGVCHTCESGLVSGDTAYDPEPLDRPADGNLLLCCAQPVRDVVIDA